MAARNTIALRSDDPLTPWRMRVVAVALLGCGWLIWSLPTYASPAIKLRQAAPPVKPLEPPTRAARSNADDLAAKGFPAMSNPRRRMLLQTIPQSLDELVLDLANPEHRALLMHESFEQWKNMRWVRNELIDSMKVLRLIEEGRTNPNAVRELLERQMQPLTGEYYERISRERTEEIARLIDGTSQFPSPAPLLDEYYLAHHRCENPVRELPRIDFYMNAGFYVLANIDALDDGNALLLSEWIRTAKPDDRNCVDINIWFINRFAKAAAIGADEFRQEHTRLMGAQLHEDNTINRSKWNAAWDARDPLIVAQQVNVADLPAINILQLPDKPIPIDAELKRQILENFTRFISSRAK